MATTSIQKSTFQFLNELKKNNNRDWFAEHKPTYQAEHESFKKFFAHVHSLMLEHDDIEKMKVHRIYRDVRFRKDKTPYKTHFSGGFARAGKRLRGGYYLHIEEGNSFLAGGFWGPNKEDLFRIRQEFAADDTEMRRIMNEPEFKKTFGTAFLGDAVKVAPKGFDKTHPAIDLIKPKQFYFEHSFSDEEVFNQEFANKVNEKFKIIRPYFDYMSDVLTTNLNGESIL